MSNPDETSNVHHCAGITRRSFLADTGMGFTGLALGAMLFQDGVAQAAPAPVPSGSRQTSADLLHGADRRLPHFPPRAKSNIWIFLCGGVSHIESFDIKPELNRYAGKSIEATPYKDVLDPKKVNAGFLAVIDRRTAGVWQAFQRRTKNGGNFLQFD